MTINTGLFSSATDEWSTPADLYELIHAEFAPVLDVCATPYNAKCAMYFTREQDGLAQEWRGVCWMNPPYGREIGKWVKKAYWSAKMNGATVVCLLPARTDTSWWHEYVIGGKAEVRFLRGRLKFGGAKNSAPFPSAVVVFDQPSIEALPKILVHEAQLNDRRHHHNGVGRPGCIHQK